MKNHSDIICNIQERTLTAKGNKFLEALRRLACSRYGVHRYSREFKDTNEKLTKYIKYMIIDKNMSLEEVASFISDAKNKKTFLN